MTMNWAGYGPGIRLPTCHKACRCNSSSPRPTRDAVELGIAGIGAAFHIGDHGMAALSIATLTARFSQERQQALTHLLKEEIGQLGPCL
ncbi:hypothetical protein ALDI51_42070 [Alicycliphilus denitrificans]|uniref:hypothetical protein n=1 Tax=Alicycliphilus denitrificans TaxID=179636 RepID=UPI001914DC13|nr:hypothetical protein [Alicycliphilus denitrificans]MBN9576016.1 hypothetical protein [Alicycliphilus denitrificans]BCN40888.1 hypothetical protein ALDI51_42070 [Alicycliphilus denitrificans]